MNGPLPNDQQAGPPDVERRLAAILALDVVGFSRMTGLDEEGTLAALKAHRRDLIDPTIHTARGRIIKTLGDGLLAEFSSSVAAVRCAVVIQQGMAERNAARAPDKCMTLRIGVHVGDVVVDEADLLGDGVNIAARLEGVADPGGVAISEDVWRQVQGKVGAAFADAGEVRLKNIAASVRVYSLRVGPPADAALASVAETRSEEKPSAPATLQDKPSIAVLAFQNISGDPEQEYFADGITDDVITDLSKIGGLLVIARSSSFAYKGKAVDIRTVGRELGVLAVLEGSIRRAGGRVRIAAQLIDARTGGHLWAERFDRDISDIFAVQDEVTRRIVDALTITLSPGELASLAATGTTNAKAHDFFLAGREFVYGPARNREAFDRTIDLFQKAIAEDPDYGEPYAGLAWAHFSNWQNNWTDDAKRGLDLAEPQIERAVAKSPASAFVRHMSMVFWSCKKDLNRALAEADRALEISPNFANALNTRGYILAYNGQPLAAISSIERAMRLDPRSKQHYLHFLGSAHLLAGDYAAAANAFRERIELSPNTDFSRAFLAVALGHLGDQAEARRVWRELEEINPNYSFEDHMARLPFRNPADAITMRQGLDKAGIECRRSDR